MTQRSGRGLAFRATPQRKVMFAVGLVVAVLGSVFAALSPGASAATTATPITDYATYPQSDLIPASCKVSGSNVLQGINFKVQRAGSPDVNTSNIGTAKLVAGDTVTMSWTDYTPGCEGLGISLAVKETPHPFFDINDNQKLYDFVYCSGADCGTANQFGNLTLSVPEPPHLCNFQFDAIIGPPLAVVGPKGSYYNNAARAQAGKPNPDGPNMLIGASNGGQGTCLAPTVEATQSCTSASGPSVDVAVTNPDDNDNAVVDVKKDGTTTDHNVTVVPGDTVHVNVPFGVSETATVSVVDKVFGEVFSQEFTFDCVHPGATIANSCTAGGAVMSFSNTGESPTDFDVTKNGVTIDTVHVAAGATEHRTFAMTEDETATFRVTSTGYDSGNVPITHDCVQVEGSTTSTSQPPSSTSTAPSTSVPDLVIGEELARTGARSTRAFTMLSGVLLVLGGLLMALANRPLPKAATTTSRGR